MNKFLTVAILGASIAVIAPAEARNVKYMMPISAALESPAAAGKLDSSVKLFFGPQAYGNSAKSGTAEASGKTRIENKVDAASCQASFVEALQALQKSAKAVGANAVVNIVSYYKNDAVTTSQTDFECHAGSFSTILSLRGDLVKLADK